MTLRRRRADPNGLMTAAIFGGMTIGVAGLLTTIRDRLGAANAVLILVVLVVGAAALGGRVAGGTTALMSALSFNFFFTEPYYSLTIESSRDVETFVLLFAIGLIASELTVQRERIRLDANRTKALLDGLLQVSEQVSQGRVAVDVWNTAERALVHGLGLLACRYEPVFESTNPLPDITLDELVPRGGRFVERGWELPEAGAALPVDFGGQRLGRIVLTPGIRRGVSVEERRVALAIAAQLGVAMSLRH